jgi:hypothetical protein
MEPQLGSLIQIEGPEVLVKKQVYHQPSGDVAPILVEVVRVEAGTTRYIVKDLYENVFHRRVDKEELGVGLGTRKRDDPLLLKMLEHGLFVEAFVKQDNPPEPRPEVRNPEGRHATFRDPPVEDQARRVRIPEPFTPTAAVLSAFTPKVMQEAEMAASAARFEKAFLNFVQKGSLVANMESILMEYPREAAKAWWSKAAYLFDIYKEPDPKAAHLMAAVYFYASRINFVSLDLEWMANAFIAEMKTLIEAQGDSANWKPDIIHNLEREIKKSFFEYRARAQKQVGEGHARPLILKGKWRRCKVSKKKVCTYNQTKAHLKRADEKSLDAEIPASRSKAVIDDDQKGQGGMTTLLKTLYDDAFK